MSLIQDAFKRLHYPSDVIAQCIRWYLTYSLSLRDLEEMMEERGIQVDHTAVQTARNNAKTTAQRHQSNNRNK